MKYRVKIFSILSALPILVFAAPSDHGRPWDDPSYHSSPLSKIFGLIAIIILIILTIGLAIGWIGSNKEKIGGILKSLFSIICGGLFIFGIIILPLLDRCGRVSSTQSPQFDAQFAMELEEKKFLAIIDKRIYYLIIIDNIFASL